MPVSRDKPPLSALHHYSSLYFTYRDMGAPDMWNPFVGSGSQNFTLIHLGKFPCAELAEGGEGSLNYFQGYFANR
jgi:hypothetical protein